jgi:hypothetical protein
LYRYGIYDPAYAGEALGEPRTDGAEAVQQRRETRVKTTIEGRVLLEPGVEGACRLIDISASGVAVSCELKPKLITRAVFYFDLLGRFEGRVVREIAGGFASSLTLSASKEVQLRGRIAWLVKNPEFVTALKRRHFRFNLANAFVKLVTATAEEPQAQVLTISLSGAGIKSRIIPKVGELVTLGATRARVVRHFPGGFAVEFLRLIPLEKMSETITL